jgi:NTE family protein
VCQSINSEHTPKVAIVLSGAESRGDFQVGALRFLFDQGVTPNFVSGTSGGVLLAAKIAEGAGALN